MRMAVLAVRVPVSVAMPFAVFVRLIVIMTGWLTMRMIVRVSVFVIVIVRMPVRPLVLIH